MFDFIIASAFVIIPAIIILISIVIGLKRNAYQSAIKLSLTIFAIVISTFLAKAFAQTIFDIVMSNDIFEDNIIEYLETENSARDIIGLIKVLILPITFVLSFIVVKFLFFLLNLIPGSLLSDKAIIRRQTAKLPVTAPDAETIYSDTYNQDITSIITEYAPYKTKSSKVINKTISVFCCVLSALLVLSSLALPINAYTKYGAIVINDCEDLLESDSGTEDVIDIITSIHEHPTNKFYTFTNGLTLRSLETFKDQKGRTVSFSNALSTTLSVVNNVYQWKSDGVSSQDVYDLADMIEKDSFVNDFVTSFIIELCDAWEIGESFYGIEAPDLENPVIASLLKELSSVDDIGKVLRAAADILKIRDVMQLNDNELNAESAKLMATQIFESISPDSVDLMKSMISEDLLMEMTELPPAVAGQISDFSGYVLDGIIEIKNDPDYSIDQTAEMIEKEAEAMSVILNMTSNPDEIDADKIVNAIVESSVISSTIQEFTQNGDVNDPFQIGDLISSDFREQVKESLDNYGISENNEMYNSILAIVG